MTDPQEDFGIARRTPDERMRDVIATSQKYRDERDRAVGAVLLMAWDGAITQSRAAELLGMNIMQIRAEAKRILTGDGT